MPPAPKKCACGLEHDLTANSAEPLGTLGPLQLYNCPCGSTFSVKTKLLKKMKRPKQ